MEESTKIKDLLANVDELNIKVQKVNEQNAETRVRKDFFRTQMEQALAKLKEINPKIDLDLNDSNFAEHLAQLEQVEYDNIKRQSDHLEEILSAQDAGNTTKLEELLGVELQSKVSVSDFELEQPAEDEEKGIPLEQVTNPQPDNNESLESESKSVDTDEVSDIEINTDQPVKPTDNPTDNPADKPVNKPTDQPAKPITIDINTNTTKSDGNVEPSDEEKASIDKVKNLFANAIGNGINDMPDQDTQSTKSEPESEVEPEPEVEPEAEPEAEAEPESKPTDQPAKEETTKPNTKEDNQDTDKPDVPDFGSFFS